MCYKQTFLLYILTVLTSFLISPGSAKLVKISELGTEGAYHVFKFSNTTEQALTFSGLLYRAEYVIVKETSIAAVPTGFMKHFPYVKKLRMSQCGIQVLKGEGAFGKANYLRVLDLNKNKIKHLRKRPFRYLKNLKSLHLDENEIQSLTMDSFVDLDQLRILHLSKNAFKKLLSEALKPLKSLEEIILNDNEIQVIQNTTFHYNEKLRRVSLYNCQIHQLDAGVFMNLKNLRILSVAANNIGELFLPSLMYLQAFDSHLKKLVVKGSIARLVIDNNDLQTLSIDNMNHTEIMVLSSTSLKSYDFISRATNLKKLDLADNNVGSKITSFVGQMHELRFLNVSNTSFPEDIRRNVFANLTQLRGLDLSHNNLTSLDPILFLNMEHLNFILLHGNRLASFDFQRVKNAGVDVRIYSLHNNQWTCDFYPHIIQFLRDNYIQLYLEDVFFAEYQERCNASLSDDDMLS